MKSNFMKRWLVLAMFVLALSSGAFAQLRVTVAFGPPAIPVYEQPLCPGDGYMWVPGYWAWSPDFQDYYWVPGTWVMAPQVGLYWTPAWWGWEGGAYLFHTGYWGPHVGFYGGINYGFGYFGDGYRGGRWDHDRFFYNREVTNINIVNIRNVYNEHVVINNNSRVSFNGGERGIQARESDEEMRWRREVHVDPSDAQLQHERSARDNRDLRASVNHGKPVIAATEKPGEFQGRVVAAKEAGGEYKGDARGAADNKSFVHPKELPPAEHLATPNTGNPKLDKKYQQQQDKLYTRQDQDRQKLQQKQDNEHAKLQNKPEAQQQLEQKHQQQTKQLVDKHNQQREQLQTKQSSKH